MSRTSPLVLVTGASGYVGGFGREQVERDPLGTLRADARQPAELVDEVLDRAFVHVRPATCRAS